jgi:hypothetical protein
MDDAAVTKQITEMFPAGTVDVLAVPSGDRFFFYRTGAEAPADHKMPFATLVTSDARDRASDLGRAGVFRLNVGVAKETYRALFGPPPPPVGASGLVEMPGVDFTALDRLLPHPVYAPQFWVCVLNPSDDTFNAKVRPLLAEAYDIAAGRQARRAGRE